MEQTIQTLKGDNQELIKENASLKRQIGGFKTSNELNKRIANNEKNIQDITGERDVAIANYDYVCGLPWYQRMFFKGK